VFLRGEEAFVVFELMEAHGVMGVEGGSWK
jgi:hypothetical protein